MRTPASFQKKKDQEKVLPRSPRLTELSSGSSVLTLADAGQVSLLQTLGK